MAQDKDYPSRHRHLILPTTIGPEEDTVLSRGEGVWVWGEDGKKYFDASSQVSCANIGHNHPKFTRWMRCFWDDAVTRKNITVVMGTDFFYRNTALLNTSLYLSEEFREIELSPVALAERLAPHLFGAEHTVFSFHVTGAQIVNNAIRFFRTVTGKPFVISFEHSFDGRDGESRDVSHSNPVHWDDAPRSGEVFFLPYPETKEEYRRAVEALNMLPLKKCACMIYEPAQGEGGGMRVGRYLKEFEALLKGEGVFSISDDIQTGLGRTGAWFGYQALGLNPDAVVMGKSLGSGHPVSAAAFKRELLDVGAFPSGKISGTFAMNPVGIAAANFTMQIYEEEGVVAHAAKLSPVFDAMLRKAIGSWDTPIGLFPYYRADGIGLYRSLKPFEYNGKPDKEERDRLMRRLRELNVLAIGASNTFQPAVRLTPPLVSTEEELQFLTNAVAQAIRSV